VQQQQLFVGNSITKGSALTPGGACCADAKPHENELQHAAKISCTVWKAGHCISAHAMGAVTAFCMTYRFHSNALCCCDVAMVETAACSKLLTMTTHLAATI
jgi:hypothetical protein